MLFRSLVPALGRLGGREQTYRRLLDGFIADLGQMEGLLRQALGAGDLAGLVRSLHTAKGVAGTLGATVLASAFAVAERSAADPAQAEHAVAVVLPVIEAARVPLIGLSAAMGPGDSAAATSPSTDLPVDLTPEVVAEIRSIAALLRDSDLAALEAVAALRGHWPHRPPDWLDPLDAAIQAMDFDAAHARCLAVLEPLDAVA